MEGDYDEIHPSLSFTMELEDNGKLPFLGMVIIRNGPRLDTKVYVKPTDTGLLLHYQSHVDVKYKQASISKSVKSQCHDMHLQTPRQWVDLKWYYDENLIIPI